MKFTDFSNEYKPVKIDYINRRVKFKNIKKDKYEKKEKKDIIIEGLNGLFLNFYGIIVTIPFCVVTLFSLLYLAFTTRNIFISELILTKFAIGLSIIIFSLFLFYFSTHLILRLLNKKYPQKVRNFLSIAPIISTFMLPKFKAKKVYFENKEVESNLLSIQNINYNFLSIITFKDYSNLKRIEVFSRKVNKFFTGNDFDLVIEFNKIPQKGYIQIWHV